MSVLIFLAILFILVLVHELGHFAVAKWTGMRVDEFGIGFPPKLFGIRKGETEYTFNLLPIGGFVKIAGEDGDSSASSPVPSEARNRQSEALAEAGEGGEDGSSESSRLFTSKSKWAQTAVLVAGVTMNVLLAWLLFTLAFSFGVRSAVSEAEASPEAVLTITEVVAGSPADKAGIPQGAEVIGAASNGEHLTLFTPSAFSEFVAAHGTGQIELTYTTPSGEHTATVAPTEGLITDDANRAAIGVGLAQIDIVKRPLGRAIMDAGTHTITSIKEIVLGIGQLAYNSIRGTADFSQVAGPVGIVGLVGQASAYGLTTLLTFTAFISLNLAVINILPFPALDGGRLLFVVIEAVKGSPIQARYAALLNTIGFFLLMILMVAVTWHDIARLLN
jgi:regulator of sigma E protease